MSVIRKGQQGAFIRSLADRSEFVGVLIYGSDAGGVREAGRNVLRALLGEAASDPFALVTLREEELKDDPGRLVDEAQSVAMFTDRRVVHVRAAGDAFRRAMQLVLSLPKTEAVIVAEAPGLKKSSALTRLFEKDERLAALPVHADEGSDLQRLISEVLADHGLDIDADARVALSALLGADRLASRNELEKLALYCRGRGRVTLRDVNAVCSDASAHVLQDMLDAFFGGDVARGSGLFAALRAEGVSAAAMLTMAGRHIAFLKTLRLAMSAGASAEEAIARARPPIFFKRRAQVRRQLSLWTLSSLDQAGESVWRATRDSRQFPELEQAVAERCLLSIALRARKLSAA